MSLDTLRSVATVLAWWMACALLAALVWSVSRRREDARVEAVAARRAAVVQRPPCEHLREHLHLGCSIEWRCLDCPHIRRVGTVCFGESVHNYKPRRSA